MFHERIRKHPTASIFEAIKWRQLYGNKSGKKHKRYMPQRGWITQVPSCGQSVFSRMSARCRIAAARWPLSRTKDFLKADTTSSVPLTIESAFDEGSHDTTAQAQASLGSNVSFLFVRKCRFLRCESFPPSFTQFQWFRFSSKCSGVRTHCFCFG